MASKTRIKLDRIATTTPVSSHGQEYVDIDLFYDKGGNSIFGGGYVNRGYYLMVSPVTVKKTDHGEMVSFGLCSGKRRFICDAKAFSERRLAEIAASAKRDGSELQTAIHETIQMVLAKNKIELATAVPV